MYALPHIRILQIPVIQLYINWMTKNTKTKQNTKHTLILPKLDRPRDIKPRCLEKPPM